MQTISQAIPGTELPQKMSIPNLFLMKIVTV